MKKDKDVEYNGSEKDVDIYIDLNKNPEDRVSCKSQKRRDFFTVLDSIVFIILTITCCFLGINDTRNTTLTDNQIIYAINNNKEDVLEKL